jgi:hypothetical protein
MNMLPCRVCGKIFETCNKHIVFCSEECRAENNRIKKSEKGKRYYEKHKVKMMEYCKEYNKKNKDRIREQRRVSSNRSEIPTAESIGRMPNGTFPTLNNSQRYKRKQRKGLHTSLHRCVWEDVFGKIPDGFVIHHINFDPKDNRIENLQAMTLPEHNKIHKHTPWNKGIKSPITMVEKIRAVKGCNYMLRCEETYDLRKKGFKTKEIAIQLGISERQVSSRIQKYKEMEGECCEKPDVSCTRVIAALSGNG